MLEVFTIGRNSGMIFLFLFLQCLSNHLRIMLHEDDYEDLRTVALKGEKLWAIHAHQQHGTVAAVELAPVEPAAIATVKGISSSKPQGGLSGRGKGRGKWSSSSCQQLALFNPAALPFVLLPSWLSRVQVGLCYYHRNFSEKATKCDGMCSWAVY
jgi:hypothetical protein